MLRRNFLRWLSTSFLWSFLPRFGRAQSRAVSDTDASMLFEVAAVVLPASLGRARTDQIGEQFIRWTEGYKAGADAGYGYGFPKIQVLPANPADKYPDQLRQLSAAARARGGPFATLDAGAKREMVAAALDEAKIDGIPTRPNGKHVAADLLSFFYGSADGQDFLYQAAIRRDDCRGLGSSGERPKPLT